MSSNINVAGKELQSLPKPQNISELTVVNAQANQIVSIDEVSEWTALTSLNLRQNKIEKIPEQLPNLKVFDISANPIRSIEPILSVTSLTELNLSQCHNVEFTFKLSQLENLKCFSSIACKHTNLGFLENCLGIEKIDLSNNLMTVVPKYIGDLTNLTYLNMADNMIDKGLHHIGKLSALEELNLAWNDISELKKSFYKLEKLTLLQLNNNKIRRIHKNIEGLVGLCEINLKNNFELKVIHENITKLTNLSRITLDGCDKLVTLPNMGEMSSLKTFRMKHGCLESLPELPKDCEIDVEYNTLKTLSENNIGRPALIYPFNKISKLNNTASNKISKVNVCGNNLKDFNLDGMNLLTLNISYNKITKLPTDLTKMTRLRQLYCSHCGLTEIDKDLLDKLPDLEFFECSFNEIDSIKFTNLPKLQSFVCQFGKLSVLPSGLAGSTKLKVLDVSNNVLKQLFDDKKVCPSFTQLTLVDVSHNNLKHIDELKNCENLIELNVSSNPIKKEEDLIKQVNGYTKLQNLIAKDIALKKCIGKLNSNVKITTDKVIDFKEYRIEMSVKQLGPETDLKRYDMIGIDLTRWQNEKVIGSYEFCGRRKSQQDSVFYGTNFLGINQHFFAVFDGHGGDYGSCFIAEKIQQALEDIRGKNIEFDLFKKQITATIQKTNQQMEERKYTDGATSVMVCTTKDYYFIANIGDSRAILVKKKGGSKKMKKEVTMKKKNEIKEKTYEGTFLDFTKFDDNSTGYDKDVSVKQITIDHKPIVYEERNRIREGGNYVNDQEKVNGYIAVSRAIGDVQCKSYLSSEPDFFMEKRSEEDCYIVCACDGVWDVLSNDDVAQICMTNEHLSVDNIAKLIVDVAFTRLSEDNISCVVYDCRQ